MNQWLTEERERVDALLGLSELPFAESQPDILPAELGALDGWRFTTADGQIEADVYVLDNLPAIEQAIQSLSEASGPVSDTGFPAVSSNGGIVFVVRLLSEAFHQQALAVAGGLAGEEE